jgi:hypothetical protein
LDRQEGAFNRYTYFVPTFHVGYLPAERGKLLFEEFCRMLNVNNRNPGSVVT